MATFEVSYLAVGLAAVVNFMFGYLWYNKLFGSLWAQQVKIMTGVDPASNDMCKALGLNFLSNVLVALAIAHLISIDTSIVDEELNLGPSVYYSLTQFPLLLWGGIMIPLLLNTVAWEKRTWTLFFINSGYYLATVIIAILIIAQF